MTKQNGSKAKVEVRFDSQIQVRIEKNAERNYFLETFMRTPCPIQKSILRG